MRPQLGKYIVPSGIPLFLGIYSVHRDPAVWPRPEEFIPERFLPVGVSGRRETKRMNTAKGMCGKLFSSVLMTGDVHSLLLFVCFLHGRIRNPACKDPACF